MASSLASVVEAELAPFRLSNEKLKELRVAFLDELQKGLEMHRRWGNEWHGEECSFRMLDSSVTAIPSGEEKGTVYALDFGGTNVRAVRCKLTGKGAMEIQQYSKNLAECTKGGPSLMAPTTTASSLFDALAGSVKTLMDKNGDGTEKIHVGFTFSFPCEQESLSTSRLAAWNKGFETGIQTKDPAVGRDVGQLLGEAFARTKTNASCDAILNDTVGTLLSCAYSRKPGSAPCSVAMIIGTGSNCCYVEPLAKEFGYQGLIINVECGNFNKKLPQTPSDVEVDWGSTNRSLQLFEKMVSGYYLGDLVRLITLRIFKDQAPKGIWKELSLGAAGCAVLAQGAVPGAKASAETIEASRAVLKSAWNWDATDEQVKILQEVAFAVFDRSAMLCAVAISALSEKSGGLESGVTVGVDGSVFSKNPWYQLRLRTHVQGIIGALRASKISVVEADDGSGKGAAVCVAALHLGPKASATPAA